MKRSRIINMLHGEYEGLHRPNIGIPKSRAATFVALALPQKWLAVHNTDREQLVINLGTNKNMF